MNVLSRSQLPPKLLAIHLDMSLLWVTCAPGMSKRRKSAPSKQTLSDNRNPRGLCHPETSVQPHGKKKKKKSALGLALSPSLVVVADVEASGACIPGLPPPVT